MPTIVEVTHVRTTNLVIEKKNTTIFLCLLLNMSASMSSNAHG